MTFLLTMPRPMMARLLSLGFHQALKLGEMLNDSVWRHHSFELVSFSEHFGEDQSTGSQRLASSGHMSVRGLQ